MPKREKPPASALERPIEAIQARANHLLWLTIEQVSEAVWAATQRPSETNLLDLVAILNTLIRTARDMPVQGHRRPSLTISFEGVHELTAITGEARQNSLPDHLGKPEVHNR